MLVRPPRWAFNPALIGPNWRRFWDGLLFASMPGDRMALVLGVPQLGINQETTNSNRYHDPSRVGNAFYNADTDGNCVYFSKTGDWQTRLGTDISIVVYANIAGLSVNSALVSAPYRDTSMTNSVFSFNRYSSGSRGSFRYVDSTDTVRVVQDAPDGFISTSDGWTLYGVTRDGTNVRFYRNGPLFVSVSDVTTNGLKFRDDLNSYIYVGDVHYQSHTAQATQGHFAAAYIWNRVLTAAEMYQLSVDPFGPLRLADWPVTAAVTYQYAYPASDISSTDWETAPTASQSLYAQLDETTRSDTDYIYYNP